MIYKILSCLWFKIVCQLNLQIAQIAIGCMADLSKHGEIKVKSDHHNSKSSC